MESELFLWPVRVYYEDTDGGGVVYYANYLKFLERARTEWLRAMGFEQSELARHEQVLFVVRSVTIEYLKPSLFDDRLHISVEVVKVGAGQIEFSQRVLRDHEVLVTASIRVACVDAGSFRPVRMPKPLATKIRMAM